MDGNAPKEYLIGHLEDALIKDGRLAEQGLHVFVANEPLIVTVRGVISGAAQEDVIVEVIQRVVPEAQVEVFTTTADYPERNDTEVVP